MVVLGALTVDDLIRVAEAVRSQEGDSMESAAEEVVRLLYGILLDERGDPACALVRFYVTQSFGNLDPALQSRAAAAAPDDVRGEITDETRCFTLLASAGAQPEWNDRRSSADHQAIPLVDERLIERLPMVSALLRDLGLELSSVVRPRPEHHLARHQRRYDVFHVADAASSPYVPDKAFVRDHRIASAVGLGGVVPSGELFCVLLFSRVPLDGRTVELLGSLAVTIKALVVPHTFRVFAEAPSR